MYVAHNNDFYPLQRQEDWFFYKAPVYLDIRQSSPKVVFTPVGGFVQNPPTLAVGVLQVQLDSGFACEEAPASARSEVAAATPTVLVFRRPDAAADRPVEVRLDGQLVGSLRGGEYLTLAASATAELSVCAQTERETCFRFRPDLHAANYLDCRLGTAAQPAPTLRLVSAEAGAAAVQTCAPAAAK